MQETTPLLWRGRGRVSKQNEEHHDEIEN